MANEIKPFSPELEERVKREFGNEATPEFLNILRLGKAAYEHGYNGLISAEKVAEWARNMYEAGKEQEKIDSGKGSGDQMILLNDADVINSGAHLSLWGKREGYLSK